MKAAAPANSLPQIQSLHAPHKLELCVTSVLGVGEGRASCRGCSVCATDCKWKKHSSAQAKELLCREKLNGVQGQSPETTHLWGKTKEKTTSAKNVLYKPIHKCLHSINALLKILTSLPTQKTVSVWCHILPCSI